MGALKSILSHVWHILICNSTITSGKSRCHILLFLFFLGFSSPMYGEWLPQLNFRHYTIDDGLSVNAVYSITQDSKGFIWFGTIDGLNRFDGRHFRVFRNADIPGQVDLGNPVYEVTEDRRQQLWIASGSGVCLLDLKTEHFIPFKTCTEEGVSITSKAYAVMEDASGRIWIGTSGQGLFCYSPATEKLVQFRHAGNDPNSLCSDNIRRIYEDASGKIWVTSLDNGIGVWHPGGSIFTNYQPTGRNDNVRNEAIFEDSQNNFWIGNDKYGLILMNRNTGTFTSYLTSESPQHIKHIRSIVEYSPGILLLASDDGLTFFNIQTTEAVTLKAEIEDLKGLNDCYLHALFIDREKGLWVGSYFGGVNYVPLAYNNFTYFGTSLIKNSIPGRIVSAFCDDPDGNLWIGTDDAGLSFFDVKRHHFTNYMPLKGQNSLSYQNIHALLCEKQKLWIGMYTGGLDVLDLKTGRFRNYREDGTETSLCSSSVYALYKDKRGTIWVGTTSGLNCYHLGTDNFSRVQVLYGQDITCIAEDNRNDLWVSTSGAGVFRLNMKTGEWQNFRCTEGLTTNQVSTICADEHGQLWFGTEGGGICFFDYKTNTIHSCTHTDFTSNVIHKIISASGELWISTNNGLMKYKPVENTVRVYSRSDGLQNNQFSPNAGIKTADGRLWFGGINGFNAFYPEKLSENKEIPPVVLTNLKIFNKDVECNSPETPLREVLGYTDHLVLTHQQSIFSIEFIALSFIAPLKNKYAYKLEGFEEDWTHIAGEPKVSYTNLPAGDYNFRVKASNSDGIWNDEETVLRLTILPPFWQTNIACMIYLLLLVALIIFIYDRLMRRTEKEHQIKLERLRSEKEKELYDAKVNFFTNIIHEIRTPLSLIIGPLSSVMGSKKSVAEVHDELAVIERNSNRLLHLVNQLMDFRKIEAEGFLLKFEKQELNALVKQVCDNFVLLLRERKTDIKFIFPERKNFVNTDIEALTKIINNLLINAVKYTRDKIEVEIIRHEGLMQVDLRISDNGNGIPEEEQEKIFQPFYQIKQSASAGIAGSGIGLTLAKSLAEAMNGNLFPEAGTDRGAVFVLRLPLLPEEAYPDNLIHTCQSEEEIREDVIEEIPGRIRNILVIDDHEELRTFLDQQLNMFYHILQACDGKMALKMLNENHVDLIVSDVMMPEMDGFELCRCIKTDIRISHIPVVLLTAKADVDAKIAGLEIGADVYIEKPFSVNHLRAQINSLLQNRERQRLRFTNMPFITSNTIAMSKADRDLLQKMDDIINKNIAESDFSIEDLASVFYMSRSTFFEKIKNVSGLSPNNYLRLVRLKKAAEILSQGEYKINEVCYLVGFSSSSYFAKCFKKQFGVLPTDFVNRKNTT